MTTIRPLGVPPVASIGEDRGNTRGGGAIRIYGGACIKDGSNITFGGTPGPDRDDRRFPNADHRAGKWVGGDETNAVDAGHLISGFGSDEPSGGIRASSAPTTVDHATKPGINDILTDFVTTVTA